jgi:hypothetical protein
VLDEYRFFRAQTWASDPGAQIGWYADLPEDLDGLRCIARDLVTHYRGGDPEILAKVGDRMGEVHTREVAQILGRLRARDPRALGPGRRPVDRFVGCCRDFTMLFVSMARHRGFAARSRVGFATYFVAGWALDHEVAEVWDATEGRWRLIDAQLAGSHVDPQDGEPIDGLDVDRARMILAGDAWRRARAGEDPERYLVDPGLDEPALRGWPYIAHNVVHDLARLNGDEMLLWESWGVLDSGEVPAELVELFDRVAAVTTDEVDFVAAQELYHSTPGLRVPETVTRFDPLGGEPVRVSGGHGVR